MTERDFVNGTLRAQLAAMTEACDTLNRANNELGDALENVEEKLAAAERRADEAREALRLIATQDIEWWRLSHYVREECDTPVDECWAIAAYALAAAALAEPQEVTP